MTNRPRVGELLVADVVLDGYWEQTVILLLDCDDDGALGVVLNRPAEAELDDLLPGWKDLVCAPQVLFNGGPVSTNGAVCVARVRDETEEPPGWRRVRGSLGLLHLDTPVELVQGAYGDLRIFAGYAGWAAGQLESELVRGDWHRLPGHIEDVFTADPAGLWRRVLRLQGGDLGLLSTFSPDADLN